MILDGRFVSVSVVPDAEYADGVAVSRLLTVLGLPRLCWPESHAHLAQVWQLTACGEDTQ